MHTPALSCGADATLTGLDLSPGKLSPAFAPEITGYTAWVSGSNSELTLTPRAPDDATVLINGTAVQRGAASAPIVLAAGPNVITVQVIGADGETAHWYSVVVTRAGLLSYGPLFIERMSDRTYVFGGTAAA